METSNSDIEKDNLDKIIYHEFYTCKDNNIFKFIVEKNNKYISISSGNYNKIFNLEEISTLIKINFFSLDNAYNYCLDLFEDNKVNINCKIKYKEIKINISLKNDKNIEISLQYVDKYQSSLVNEHIKQLKNEIKNLKNKNDKLEKEINTIKQNILNKNNAPRNIKLLHTVEEKAYADYGLDNTFAVFISFNNILYLVYSTIKKSMICYDIRNKSLISEMKNCHLGYITNLRHFADKINKIDIVMTISNEENNIKLWNIRNLTCILNLNKVNKIGFLYSACFLTYNSENFIITSNYDEFGHSEYLKIFNFKGQKVKEIKKSNEPTFLVENYFDDVFNCHNYIITGNLNYVKAYIFNKNELYHKYFDGCINGYHYCIIIINQNGVVKLMESCEDGNIRIWHFHCCKLLMRIKVCKENINGMSLYNDKYVFVGSDNQYIKLVNIEDGSIIKKLHAHPKEVLNLKIIFNSKYGDILISQAYEEDQIRIWTIEN